MLWVTLVGGSLLWVVSDWEVPVGCSLFWGVESEAPVALGEFETVWVGSVDGGLLFSGVVSVA